MLYTDPLLPPAEWPGVRATYRFAASPSRLVLSLVFDPARVTDGEDVAEQRVEAALLRYAVVAAQLTDAGTRVEVVQSVLPADGGAVGDGAAIGAELAGFAGRVVAELHAALAGGTAAPVPLEVAIPLDPAGLASRADDIFPVTVSLVLSRPPERVDPRARAAVPGADRAATELAPDLDPAEDAGGTPADDAGLARFAAGFRAAFAGFDGAGGAALLAVRTGPAGSSGPAGNPVLWGVRWSPAHGIHAAFRPAGAACFAPAPLGTGLLDGTARVPDLHPDTLEATHARRTFSAVDLDDWAGAFLEAMDEVLSPAVGAAVAVLDGASYRALTDARAQLARALAAGLVPVFPSGPAGDPAAARDGFEEGALASLSAAFAAACIVQVPADVVVAGAAGPASVPPRFLGGVAVAGADATEEHVPAGGGIGLALRATTTEHPGFLTFPATAEEPGRAAELVPELRYRPDVLERPAAADAAAVPTAPERLRLLTGAPGGVLDLPLGRVSILVPLRAFPAAPSLTEHRAEQSPDDGTGTAADPPLLWDYTATLTLPGLAAQDQLWVSLAYDLPLDGPAPQASRPAAEPGPVVALFEALASFTTAWPVLRPHLAALPGRVPADNGHPAPSRVVAALLEQVQPVAAAWSALRGTNAGDAAADAVPGPSLAADAPPAGDEYVVSFADAFTTGVLRVFAQGKPAQDGGSDPSGIVWPRIAGRESGPPAPAGDAAPDGAGGWFAADYAYPAPSNRRSGALTLALTWPRLDAAVRQTARAEFRTVRNAGLRAGVSTAPELVRRTAPVSFASPVAPTLVVPPRVFAPGSGLAGTLEEALRVFAAAGSALGGERRLRVAVAYRFPLDVPGGGDAPWSELPVLLLPDLLLASGSTGSASGTETTLRQLAAELATQVDAWYRRTGPSTGPARLSLDVALSAGADGARVPVVRAPESVVEVPAGWWPAEGEPAGGVDRESRHE